jgi:spermidine/putrescine transport system substrate-binding protein
MIVCVSRRGLRCLLLVRVLLAFSLGLFSAPLVARAEGELHIYNWTAYTSAKVIEKFSRTYGVTVTVDEYESDREMLAAVRADGSSYDVVVPAEWTVKLMIDEGLLAETRPNQMENFRHLDSRWIDYPWDPGRNYSVPYLWGTTGLGIDTAVYDGDSDSLKLLFEPPPELQGRIGIVTQEVIHAALRYLAKPICGDSDEDLAALTALVMSAKRHWRSIYNSPWDAMVSGEAALVYSWSGLVWLVRRERPTWKYFYPREGFAGWMDNVVVLKDAPNLENANLFQNFLMDPEIAAWNSEAFGLFNAVRGSEKFLPPDFFEAPEIKLPAGTEPEFAPLCPKEVRDKYDAIWAEVTK